jgi:hypothetical protein
MQRTVVNYLMIAFLLLTYINRGLFIAAYEVENHSNKEVNSVVEWVIQLVTGEENELDEDGDSQSDCHFVKIVQHDFCQQIAKNFELASLFSKNIKTFFPRNEKLSNRDVYGQIDQPPESV